MTFFTFAKGKKELINTEPCNYNIPSYIGKGPKFSFGIRPKDLPPSKTG